MFDIPHAKKIANKPFCFRQDLLGDLVIEACDEIERLRKRLEVAEKVVEAARVIDMESSEIAIYAALAAYDEVKGV